MIRRPRFKNDLQVEIIPPDLVFFLYESGYKVLQGELLCLIAPLINAKNSLRDIAVRLKGRATLFDVECALFLLESEGCIESGDDSRLKTKRVAVVSFTKSPIPQFTSILTRLGVPVTKREPDFTVVLVDDYLEEKLAYFHLEAIRKKLPWMIVKPSGLTFWLGPIFDPPTTPCWSCLAQRLRQNRRAEAFLQAHTGKKRIAEPAITLVPAALDAALNLAAINVAKAIKNPSSSALLTFDVKEMKLERHPIAKLDQCAHCGTTGKKLTDLQQSSLKSRKKVFTNDGHRSVSADITFQNYQHHISPLTGIIDEVKPYQSNANGFVHSFVAGHLFIPRLQKQDLLIRGLIQQSGGKGITAQQAKTSALCEALERYSGLFRGNEKRITATYRELGNKAIHPNSCMNFSERQYENREKWNRQHSNHDWVPIPFDEKLEIEWSAVWSLSDQTSKYIPTAYCYYGYPLPANHQFCRADSNGNAAGNSLEEAILHGFLELVERDATTLWWFNRIRRPSVALESFSHPYLNALREYYRTIRRDFWVLDITSDFNIPSFVSISANNRSKASQILMGFGAHLNPGIAMIRAVTEMNQFLPAAMAGRSTAALRKAQTFLYHDPRLPAKELEDFPKQETDDFRDDVKICVNKAKQLGMQAFVLNQTRSDVGLPTVKVIVPGMRQFWARLGKGRLYDVPVNLGWIKKPLTESQLNSARIVI